jgi:outer membrane protein assembly factor BamB
MRKSAVVAAAVVCWMAAGIAGSSRASDWPQFLGPDRNGTSKETGLARSWPADGPRVIWTRIVGAGYAGPCVRDGKLYILDRKGGRDDAKDGLRVLDFATGKDIWKYVYDAPGRFSHNGSRSTPAVDDKYIFTVGPMGHFYCFSKKTQKPVWSKNLLKDFGGRLPMWAVAQSPLLYKSVVIVAPQKQAGVIACDKATGRIVWKTPSNSGMSYASPSIMNIGGVDQVVMLSEKGTVTGIDANRGKVLWTYRGWSCRIPINSPCDIGDGRIFISGEYGAGSAMIRVTGRGGRFRVTELYKTDKVGAQIHAPMLYKGHLYANSNGNSRRDGLLCMDLDGNVKWKTEGSPNFERGNMIMADDLIFIADGKTGMLHLVEPNSNGYKELAKVKMFNTKEPWAPMALVDGKLLVRDQRELKCLDVKAR